MKSIIYSKATAVIIAFVMAVTIVAIPVFPGSGVYADNIPKAASYKNTIAATKTFMAGGTLTFTAYGDRQNEVGSIEGETKYVPYKWELDGKRDYEGYFSGNYTKKIKLSVPSRYELEIEYKCYEYKTGGTGIGQWVEMPNDDYDDDKEAIVTVKGKIKFNVNKGKKISEKKRSKIVTPGKKYGKLPKPTRKGYKFKGWYTKKKGGKKITAGKKVSLSKGTTTLYAKWTKKGQSSSGRTKSGYITASRAKKIALKRTNGGKVTKCHLDYDDGIRQYEIEIIKGDWEYDLEIHAKTGRILDYDKDSRYDD